MLTFADTKDVIMEYYPWDFLEGKWKTADKQYKLETTFSDSRKKISFSTNLPSLELSGSTANIISGRYNLSNGKQSKNVYKFTILSKDSIDVYCYADMTTRTLYKQK